MNEHAKMLCFMAGTGIKIHNSVREKGPVQRRDCKGEQFDVEVERDVRSAPRPETHFDRPSLGT
jgi:hypothetical protein